MSAEGWYVRRGRQVKGPFPSSVIARYRARGKFRDGDEISPDLRTWKPLCELGAETGSATRGRRPSPAAQDVRAKGSGAKGSGAKEPGAKGPGAAGPGARVEPPLAPRSRYVERLLTQRDNRWVQGATVGVLLATILGVGLSVGVGERTAGADCAAAAGPSVNWSSCSKDGARLGGFDLQGAKLRATRLRDANLKGADLRGADLAYAELGGADLAYAALEGASLKGADLTGTDLSNADLDGADLSYADLGRASTGGARFDGALLDNAIWLDGRVCATASVGRCR